jgi:hypothetical protein
MRTSKRVERADGTLIRQEDGVEALLRIYAQYHWMTTSLATIVFQTEGQTDLPSSFLEVRGANNMEANVDVGKSEMDR